MAGTSLAAVRAPVCDVASSGEYETQGEDRRGGVRSNAQRGHAGRVRSDASAASTGMCCLCARTHCERRQRQIATKAKQPVVPKGTQAKVPRVLPAAPAVVKPSYDTAPDEEVHNAAADSTRMDCVVMSTSFSRRRCRSATGASQDEEKGCESQEGAYASCVYAHVHLCRVCSLQTARTIAASKAALPPPLVGALTDVPDEECECDVMLCA
jgi:hypothetical protein